MIPLQARDFTGAVGFQLDRAGIDEVGRVTHEGAPVRRSIVIRDRLFTISDAGAMTSTLDGLSRRSFVAFGD